MSCEDTLHINFKQLSQWIVMMWGPDRPLWKSALSIGFGTVQIARVKQFLIKSQWRSWLDLLEHWVSFQRRLPLTFLRKPWNPLSCNSITIHLRGWEGSVAAARRLQESYFIGTCGHQHWAGQSESHIWGTKVSFHTWTATGRKNSKFNYRDSIGKHAHTHKTKRGHKRMHMQLHAHTCIHTDTHTHARVYIQMKGNEMAANPSTLDRNQFSTWNLCWGETLIGGQIRPCLLLITQATATHVP